MKNIERLVDEGGDISIGPLAPLVCVAAASDGYNSLAMLVRREGETLAALMKRLDKAIALAWSDELFTDEVNGPNYRGDIVKTGSPDAYRASALQRELHPDVGPCRPVRPRFALSWQVTNEIERSKHPPG